MNNIEFQSVLDAQIQRVRDILEHKAEEYASDVDRLANFKTAGGIKGESPKQALAGMMAKHTVSIYDMVLRTDRDYSTKVWDEKITDHINYLILLRALVEEDILPGLKEHSA